MQAIHQEILPASGVQFATCLKLLPTTLLSRDSLPSSDPSGLLAFSRRSLFNVVVARSNVLRIFEVVEELAPMDTQREEERERKAVVRKGTESVEGEVEMDADGEGFINLGQIKVNSTTCPRYSTPIRRLSPLITSCLKREATGRLVLTVSPRHLSRLPRRKRLVPRQLPDFTLFVNIAYTESLLVWKVSESCPRSRTIWNASSCHLKTPR
jgi:hypothetical protein